MYIYLEICYKRCLTHIHYQMKQKQLSYLHKRGTSLDSLELLFYGHEFLTTRYILLQTVRIPIPQSGLKVGNYL